MIDLYALTMATQSDKRMPFLNRALQSEGSIRLSASQMLLFLRILPLLVGDKIPEENEYWLCFLVLRKVVDIVLSPVF